MGNKHRFKLVVFDWDGTLLDSEDQIVTSLFATCEELGLASPSREAVKNIIGLGLSEALEQLFPSAGKDLHERIIDSYRHHFLTHRAPARLFQGVVETLHQFQADGYLLGVATGKARRGLDRSLEETGCKALFHATRCADEAFSKPHPQMLQDVMDVLGAEPRDTLMVGDTEYDMQMANNAGTAAVAVDYGVHDKERLLRHEPLGCIRAIAELRQWL